MTKVHTQSVQCNISISNTVQKAIELAIPMHHTAFVPYSITAGCSLTNNYLALLPVL